MRPYPLLLWDTTTILHTFFTTNYAADGQNYRRTLKNSFSIILFMKISFPINDHVLSFYKCHFVKKFPALFSLWNFVCVTDFRDIVQTTMIKEDISKNSPLLFKQTISNAYNIDVSRIQMGNVNSVNCEM